MRLAIASDHGGFQLKQMLVNHLKALGHDVLDLGTDSDQSVDYPHFAENLCRAVLAEKAERGILICGTGIGMAITANKFKGIYAAICTNEFMARMAREHNDSNVLCLGGRVLGDDLAKSIVETWVNTSPDHSERHARRRAQISMIEKTWSQT